MDHHEKVKVALITGCSTDVGHATALSLNVEGFHVVAGGPSLEELRELRDRGCEVIELDVTDEAQCRRAVDIAERHHGAVDVLVINTAHEQSGQIEKLPLDEIRRDFEVNVFSAVRMSQLVLPAMRRQRKGRIINLTSPASETEGGIYHATKNAIEAITAGLRVEVEEFGIDVIGIQPTGGIADPVEIAKTIVEAATDDAPAARYYVGMFSRRFAVPTRFTPDSVWDAAMRIKRPGEHRKHH